ncbi:MAG: PSD1 domain-containing protein [Acidobacteria bacterium]|nr:PSD1 domain-containing protein [Acidobacteriota bacterium]MBI3426499.1 PSD1 domain-containing protein [Acidobacteriota bacterium]
MAKKFKLALCSAVCLSAFVWLCERGLPQFASAQTRPLDFKRDIEPILAANCYGCHGAQKASGQLRLDLQATAIRGGLSGVVILPGKGKDSRLVQRLRGLGGEQRMPLGKSALSAQQINLIELWIDQGATWPADQSAIRNPQSAIPQHWAFVTPVRPALPMVKDKTWGKTPVDTFVLARLEKEGLTPSPQADKTTLARRLYLDLLGLPPTLQELDAFMADTSPDAYEKLVERLLASPHYGERWGRWWLDAARYADSNGFEKDRPRSIWPYRDWVIKAFNEDKRFDQFTIEQLAGDLLPKATLEQRIATGFLRNSMRNEEGGVDPEQFRVEEIIDRVDATGKAFLGLTVNCAQCHTHKFDPIKHEEYYRFYAFLNSDIEAELDVPDAKVTAKRAEINQAVAKLEDELSAKTPDLTARLAAWEEQMKPLAGAWQVLEDSTVTASFGVKFERLPDGSYAARGDASTNNSYVIKAKTAQSNITGIRLEVLSDVSLPRGGPGRRNDGVAAVNEFTIETVPYDNKEERPSGAKVAFGQVSSDFETPKNLAKFAADGDGKTAWSTDTLVAERHQDRKLVFALQQPLTLGAEKQFVFQLIQKYPDNNAIDWGVHSTVGRFRVSVTSAPNPQADPLPARVRQLLATPVAQRTKEQQREVFSFYRTTVKEWSETNQKIEELLRAWPYGDVTLALAERSVPRPTHIFRRGDWKRPEAETITPGTPAFLHPFPANAPRNRLGLAQWIVAKDNPLTPRVIVNRLWQSYFGAGLVTTPEDLGTRCEPASYPELLDWLAREFWDNGKSFKNVHRLIVNSATYRQASRITPKLQEADPTNRWLARAPRFRVEAETVRDIALAASGLLSRKIGGPSVYPPIPEGVLSLSFGRAMDWKTVPGEDRYRRGMYTFWKRNVPYPALQVFDMPNGDFACTRRTRSNTPLQALTTLNDATFMEMAQVFALRIWKEGGADEHVRMQYAFRLCTSRVPDAFELERLLKLLHEEQQQFAGKTAAAVYVSSADLNKLPEDVDLHQLAPWTMVARALLNLDETITKQ